MENKQYLENCGQVCIDQYKEPRFGGEWWTVKKNGKVGTTQSIMNQLAVLVMEGINQILYWSKVWLDVWFKEKVLAIVGQMSQR